MELAGDLLGQIAAEFPNQLSKSDSKSFKDIDVIDLEDMPDGPSSPDDYDTWATTLSSSRTKPIWVVHTPQTPRPRLNRDSESGSSLGFDLILPGGFGEALSGGERDKRELTSFWPERFVTSKLSSSSGFGLGLERLLNYLMAGTGVASVRLPHHGRVQ